MGLLDALTQGSQGGYGGLLDALFYPSPLTQQGGAQPPQQPQYDQMGNPIGAAPQSAASPFPALPQANYAQFAPKPESPLFSPFNQGAAPITGVPQIQPPQAPQPSPQNVGQPPQVAQQPPESNPINTMNVGGYQMPQFGTAADYTPQPQAVARGPSTDVSAQSRGPEQQLPPALGGQPGGLSGAFQGFAANAHNGPLGMLLGGVGGAMGAENPEKQNLRAQYQAFIGAGLSPQKAMLAVMNPEAAKTLVGEALTSKEKWGEIGSDSFGNKTMGWINERDQTINGKEMGATDNAASGSSTGFLAPGVKGIDSSLTGADYLKQFSPEVQAAVENYVQGKSMPTGNPRKGFTQTVKMIAQKYGADTGQTVDDATYGARRTMRNQLSSSAPSSLGGQINIGNTAAGHLADLTQKAIELGNVDTGIAPLSALVNNARGLGTEQAAKMEALKGAAQHYGQEITKFYAGSPGGVAERDRFIESVNGARSPKELAAILSTEAELMRSRLDALGGQIKGVLGEEGMKQYPVLRPDGEAALAKVEQNVSRLKGGQGAATVGFTEGQTATNPKTGQTLTFRNGKWQ